MPSVSLMNGSLSLKDYGQLLTTLYRIHSTIEQPLKVALKKYPSLAAHYEAHLPWLAEDLRAMGVAPPYPVEPIGLPNDDAATLAGMMYVLQGATLGGQVILKGLRKNTMLAHLPHRYYTGYGTQTGGKWKSFLDTLEAVVQPEELAAAVAGANFTFKTFMEQLQGLHNS